MAEPISQTNTPTIVANVDKGLASGNASFWENAPCSTRNTPFFGWKNLRLAPKSLLLHSISSCPEEEGVSKCKANCSF